jgi:hypothetical protein
MLIKKTSEGIGSRNVIPRTIDGVSWDSLLMLTEKWYKNNVKSRGLDGGAGWMGWM